MRVMLTTLDNPYDPFEEFPQWYAFDEAHGYHTCGLLAAFTVSSDELSDEDQENDNEEAIQEILELNPFGIHRKVYRKNKIK